MAYGYWVNNLFERMAKLFDWKNTGDDLHGGIDPEHIEKYLLLNGNVGITKYNGDLTAFMGSYSGVSIYYDRFPLYMVRSPLYSGVRTIGKDITVIRNNTCESDVKRLCHRYAIMLGHCECTLVTLLVNSRVSSVPTVNTNKEKAIIDAWRNGVYNGKLTTVLDSGFLSVKWQDINVKSLTTLSELMETRERLLISFYHDIGVKCTPVKNGNMINAEVNNDDSMLLLNIDDMLKERRKGCERVNEMFGTNWTVDKCEELQYNATSVDPVRGESANNGVI